MTEFLRQHRWRMVRYAHRVMVQFTNGHTAWGLAEDAVQSAVVYYLTRGDRWNEARFVGAVRFAALTIRAKVSQVIEVRNTAGESRNGMVRSGPRRSRVTSTFPTQIFGMPLHRVPFGMAAMADAEEGEAPPLGLYHDSIFLDAADEMQ
jgi:hypothetical protein